LSDSLSRAPKLNFEELSNWVSHLCRADLFPIDQIPFESLPNRLANDIFGGGIGFNHVKDRPKRLGEFEPLCRFDIPLGGNKGKANGVNNRGEVVGYAETTTPDPTCERPQVFQVQPVIWKKGEVRELPTFSGDPDGRAYAINDSGQAAGFSGNCTTPFHAVLWQDETVTDLGNLGGTLNNFALDNPVAPRVRRERTTLEGAGQCSMKATVYHRNGAATPLSGTDLIRLHIWFNNSHKENRVNAAVMMKRIAEASPRFKARIAVSFLRSAHWRQYSASSSFARWNSQRTHRGLGHETHNPSNPSQGFILRSNRDTMTVEGEAQLW
jgi:probable HAF family extracellular repeat protein